MISGKSPSPRFTPPSVAANGVMWRSVNGKVEAYDHLSDDRKNWACISLPCGTLSTTVNHRLASRFLAVYEPTNLVERATRKGVKYMLVRHPLSGYAFVKFADIGDFSKHDDAAFRFLRSAGSNNPATVKVSALFGYLNRSEIDKIVNYKLEIGQFVKFDVNGVEVLGTIDKLGKDVSQVRSRLFNNALVSVETLGLRPIAA